MSEDLREETTGRRGPALPDRPRLVLASFLMLFVELALIRWTGCQRHLPRLPHELRAAGELPRHRHRLPAGRGASVTCSRSAPLALARAGRLRAASSRSHRPSTGGDGWISAARRHAGAAAAGSACRPSSCSPSRCSPASAQERRAHVRRFEPLEAYRLDIAGQPRRHRRVLGLSFVRLPPLGWGVVVAGRVRAAARPATAPGGRGRGGAGRRAARRRVAARRLLLVAVLQDHARCPTPDGSVKRRREQHAAPDGQPVERARRSDPFYRYPYSATPARSTTC